MMEHRHRVMFPVTVVVDGTRKPESRLPMK